MMELRAELRQTGGDTDELTRTSSRGDRSTRARQEAVDAEVESGRLADTLGRVALLYRISCADAAEELQTAAELVYQAVDSAFCGDNDRRLDKGSRARHKLRTERFWLYGTAVWSHILIGMLDETLFRLCGHDVHDVSAACKGHVGKNILVPNTFLADDDGVARNSFLSIAVARHLMSFLEFGCCMAHAHDFVQRAKYSINWKGDRYLAMKGAVTLISIGEIVHGVMNPTHRAGRPFARAIRPLLVIDYHPVVRSLHKQTIKAMYALKVIPPPSLPPARPPAPPTLCVAAACARAADR